MQYVDGVQKVSPQSDVLCSDLVFPLTPDPPLQPQPRTPKPFYEDIRGLVTSSRSPKPQSESIQTLRRAGGLSTFTPSQCSSTVVGPESKERDTQGPLLGKRLPNNTRNLLYDRHIVNRTPDLLWFTNYLQSKDNYIIVDVIITLVGVIIIKIRYSEKVGY